MAVTAIVLWVVALAFIFVTVKNMIQRSIKTRRCTASVSGVISDVKEKVIRRNNVTSREYIPTVTYNVAGVDYTKEFTKAYHADTYSVGQPVDIMYNPGKPTEINKVGGSSKTDLVMLVIGIVIAVIGAVLLAIG